MRPRLLAPLLWWAALCACVAPSVAFWQSRDSNYNKSVGSAAYSGPGDVVSGAFTWVGLRAYSLAKAGTKSANICNSGDANCADVNTLANGNFDVATATGSPLNCGGAGGTCTVKTLYDQSGNTNCSATACDLTNAIAANRPTLVLNCLGSLPCMAFSGTQSLTSANTIGASQSQPFTLSVVLKFTGAPAFVSFWGGSVNGDNFVGHWNTANNWRINSGTNLQVGGISDASFHAIQGLLNTTSSNFYVDGSANVGDAGADTFASTAKIVIGGDAFGASWVGNGTEAGLWKSDITSSMSALNSNQHSYWGF